MMRVLAAVAVTSLSLTPAITRAEEGDEAGASELQTAEQEQPPSDAPAEPQADPTAGEPISNDASGSSTAIESEVPKGRMTLPGGGFQLGVIVETNLASGKIAKPISVAPDLWFGLHDRITVGVYHSGRATTGFLTSYGNGLCFRDGMSGICKAGLGELYTFGGGEVRIGLSHGSFATALVLGGNARFFDPDALLAAKAGFLARIHTQRIGIEVSPVALIGINRRNAMDGAVNKDLLFVPVTLYVRLTPRASLALQSGLSAPFKNAADNFKIPAAAGLSLWLSNHLAIDAAFGLAAVADKDDATKPFDQRSVTVGLSYAK